jgi:gliding motility-associated lipoprotein GldH
MHKYFLFIISVLLFTACDSPFVYDQFKPIENQKWSSGNKIEFIVNNIDTISKKNVFINIRSNKDYEFSSLFLITEIKFPQGLHVVDTLEYEMTNAKGEWLGTGFTEIKENKLFYKEKVVFNEKGEYVFSIQQATRSINDIEGSNPLNGITDVGLSIETVK